MLESNGFPVGCLAMQWWNEIADIWMFAYSLIETRRACCRACRALFIQALTETNARSEARIRACVFDLLTPCWTLSTSLFERNIIRCTNRMLRPTVPSRVSITYFGLSKLWEICKDESRQIEEVICRLVSLFYRSRLMLRVASYKRRVRPERRGIPASAKL